MSIVETHPAVAAQWHPTKNENLKPENITSGSGIPVWWLCNNKCECGCVHEWETPMYSRKEGSGCPYCSTPQKKICIHQSITHTHPEVAAQWHPTRNGDLKPESYGKGSEKKAWWLCKNSCSKGCKHEWPATIANRTKSTNTGCPYCSDHSPKNLCIHTSFVTTHPEIAKEWHPTKNGSLKPEIYLSGSGKKGWWLCKNTCSEGCKHEWPAAIGDRCNGRGCPYCSEPCKKICIHKSIVYTHPKIASQWHPTKNGDLKPENYSKGSNVPGVWWLCENKCEYGCLHEWPATINTRCQDHGCPFCGTNGKAFCYHSSIEFKLPKLCQEIHTVKNKDIAAIKLLSCGSNRKVWWQCPKNIDHEWETVISNRSLLGNGCPFCRNKTEAKLFEFLKKHHPDVITQLKLDCCKNITFLPFDFAILLIKTIIELDGGHHFIQVSNWTAPEETLKRDIYKMQRAEAEQYKVIRISQQDVLDNDDNWLEENLLPHIIGEDRSHAFISSVPDMYDSHKELYNRKIKITLDDSDIVE
jgi:very-short-patch-repair endonuclease